MSHFLFIILLHLIPLMLLMIPFLLVFDVSLKSKKNLPKPQKPDVNELERNLKNLIKNNHLSVQIDELQKDLQKTPSHTVSAYIKLNKKDLKGFHLFQLIFALIKNQEEDYKIIKILRHYLPSCATTHLHAILRSFKIFLNVSAEDHKQKELLKDLNNNRVRTTLLYLEQKINQTLNLVPSSPPAMQQLIIDKAVVYGLVFASFCEFYDNSATEKILRLANLLSPEIFKYWHIVPEQNTPEHLIYQQKTSHSSRSNLLN